MEGIQPREQRILTSCRAYFLGEAIPRQTTAYPDIIYEPLKHIYSSCKVKRPDLLRQTTSYVEVQIFNSGIIVKEKGEKIQSKHLTNWYPIQNLYCSASLKPDKERKTKALTFSELRANDQTRQPLFAMVMRQPGKDGRRVLMCLAFLTDDVAQARQLVRATQQAYQSRDGWNHPVADKEFLNAKLAYTLEQIQVDEESSLEELKVKTNERDEFLAQHPSPPRPQASVRGPSRVHTSVRSSQRVQLPAKSPPQPTYSVVTHSSQPSGSIMLRGASASLRPMSASYRRAPVVFAAEQPPVGGEARMPTPRAQSLYQGFNTEAGNSQYHSIQPAPARASSAIFTADQPAPANSRPTSFRETGESPRRWRNRMSDTPRGHRVIASSEPQELSNGLSNGEGISIVDWDAAIDTAKDQEIHHVAHGKSDKHSKHHRPSKKTMEKFLHQNGGGAEVASKGRVRRSSQESGSSYSITKLNGEMNGFLSGHEQADQSL